tara:strand:+ start:184 stop:1125 length:942 start_codon:yes stop_codon:yes gene_type:complete
MGIDIEEDTRNFLKMLNKKTNVKPVTYKKRLLISGMGGSGIAGRILETLGYYDSIGEIIAWTDYGLPNWIKPEDNIICISYSGNTAETLSAAIEAQKRGCTIEVITTGGKLGSLAEKNRWDKIVVEEGHQPRAALPLLLKPLLHKLNLPNLKEITADVSNQKYEKNKSKTIAGNIFTKIPCIYTEPVLEPVGYRWRCQIQENAKQLAFHHIIPEMNHNEIVGWTNSNPNMIPILVRKNDENNEIRNRFEALKNTAWKNVKIVEIFARCKTHLAQILETIYVGDMLSIQLAKLNKVDPTAVKVIESLKKQLDGK